MINQPTMNPMVSSKIILWIVVVIMATILLYRRKMTARVRLLFIIAGVVVFGFGYGLLLRQVLNPNPVASTRTALTALLVQHRVVAPLVAILVVLLLISWISNKSICGYGCQLGLLQDLLHRVPLPKWRPPFVFANAVRVVAFVALIAGLTLGALDWIALVDPFQLFQFNFTVAIALFTIAVLAASLFVYRPWCRFLCPFGLISWGVEQVSLLRPRIDRAACKECKLCVKACPTQAMADFYADKAIHADCFACGACIAACPQHDALKWRK